MNAHKPGVTISLFFAILALLIAGVVFVESKASRSNLHRETPLPAEADDTEEVEKAIEWFRFQRAYPFDSIPAGARQRAWSARPKDFSTQRLASQTGTNWISLGPTPTTSAVPNNWGATSGRLTAIAVSPADPQLILIGGAVGGIWRSTDGGTTFAPTTDDKVDLAVGSIEFSNQNPSIVYAGMGDILGYLGTGVLKSTDAGQTWVTINNGSLPSVGGITSLRVEPTDSNRVYLGQFEFRTVLGSVFSSALFVSTDGGVNWGRKLPGLTKDLAVSPTNPRTVYLATTRVDTNPSQPAGLYKSTDGGDNWSNIFLSPYDVTRDCKVAVASDQVIYVYIGGTIVNKFDIRVMATTDGGATWDNRGAANLDSGQFGYNSYIAVQPGDPNSIYVGTRDIFKSTDAGHTYVNITKNLTPSGTGFQFTPSNSNSHIDQHALTFAPSAPATIYIGNDGGLSRSTDSGANFSSLNSALSLSQIYGITIDPSDPTISYIGTQDNGMQRKGTAPLQWNELITGDYKNIVANPLDTSTIVVNYIETNIFRFRNHGDDFDRQIGTERTFGEPTGNPRVSFLAPLIGNRSDGTLFFGTWRLFISRDFGDTWQAPANNLDLTRGGDDVLSTIGIGKSNPAVIYTGSERGRAMLSTDSGETWSDITAGLPNRFITGITVDDNNSSVAYLCVSGFGSGHVFKTTNAGTTWVDQSGNLPDIPTNAVAIDPLDPNTIYAGTDIGVFRSPVGGGDWFTFNDGLPPVVVRAFATDPVGVVQAATFGRGVYQLGTVSLPLPEITGITVKGKKNFKIEGDHFGSSPRVRINDVDRSDFIVSTTPQLISLKGKAKKLGLVSGSNTIQVITSVGTSNSFVLLR